MAALRAQPGTAHYVAEADDDISVLGLADHLSLTGFGGDASWTGYGMIAGHWYSGPGEVDVNTAFLTDTGTKVGDTYTLTSGGRHLTVRIAGEVFDPSEGRTEIIGATSTLAALDPGLATSQYDVALKPGTDVQAYVHGVGTALGHDNQGSGSPHPTAAAPAVLRHHRPDRHADAAAGRGGRARRAQHRGAADPRTRARPGRVQGHRHDAPADHCHGGVLGRRDRPGRRPDRDPGRASPCTTTCCRSWAMPRRPTCQRRCSTCTTRWKSSCSRLGPGHRRGGRAAPSQLGGTRPHSVRLAGRMTGRTRTRWEEADHRSRGLACHASPRDRRRTGGPPATKTANPRAHPAQ